MQSTMSLEYLEGVQTPRGGKVGLKKSVFNEFVLLSELLTLANPHYRYDFPLKLKFSC